jgi:hypothetical protein
MTLTWPTLILALLIVISAASKPKSPPKHAGESQHKHGKHHGKGKGHDGKKGHKSQGGGKAGEAHARALGELFVRSLLDALD